MANRTNMEYTPEPPMPSTPAEAQELLIGIEACEHLRVIDNYYGSDNEGFCLNCNQEVNLNE